MPDDALLSILAASIAAIVLLAYPGYRVLSNLVRAIAHLLGKMIGK